MTLIPQSEIDDLKGRTDIVTVVSRYLELKRQGQGFVGRCPFHEKDDTPSLRVDPVKGLWNCLGGCSANGNPGGGKGKSGGDVFAFIMKIEKVDFRGAAKHLGLGVKDEGAPPKRNGHSGPKAVAPTAATAATVALSTATLSTAGQSRAPRTAYLSRVVDHWQQELAINRRAQEYLEIRGLLTKELWRAFKIGYSSGSVEELAGSEESEAHEALQELGVLSKDGKESMKGRLVFPLMALNQLPVSVYGRSIHDGHEPRHMLLSGPRQGLFNWNAARRAKELLLVESVMCTMSLLESQLPNVIPLCGSSMIPYELWDLVTRFSVETIVLGLDADETGRQKAPVLAEELRAKGLFVRTIEWPEKDPNEILVKLGPKKLREIADKLLAAPKTCDVSAGYPRELAGAGAHENAVTVSEAAKPLLTASSSPDAAPIVDEDLAARKRSSEGAAATNAPTQPAKPDLLASGLTLTYDDRLWDVNWQNGPDGQLRAHVKIFLGAAEVPAFLDSLNLRSSRSRDGFTKKAASLALPLGAPAKEQQQLLRLLEGDLMRIAELGEERRKAAETKSDERPGTLTEERRRVAMAYAKAPHLLARVVFDIGAAGYVGEPTIKALSYLVSISRKLPEALSMVILSSSGSGKSALADVLEKLTPEEDLVVVTRFTASSLYWMPRDALKRKFVSIEERSGSQEADYSIRALQSKRKVTMMAPIKDQATGKLETKFFEVEGPASFLESTTESQIHHENATRCFEVRLDESREQTMRIQDAQRFAKTLEGHRARSKGQEIAALHQDLQRLLRPVRVVIPYASAIEFPAESIRTRRDNPRFLNLIDALAFLHQYQRPLTLFESGQKSERPLEEIPDEELDTVRVEATLDDYAMAYELASDLLYETLAELKRPLRVFFSAIRELARGKGQDAESAQSARPVKVSEVSLLQRQIRDFTRLEPHTVRRYLAELVELEYLAVNRAMNGGASAYRVVNLPEKEGGRIPGLLLPEELFEKLERLKRERPS
jgi:DNA primase